MLAVHFENLLFLLLVAVAFLFQLLTRVASKASKDSGQTRRRSTSRPQTPRQIPHAPETDEERVRKFLEALGQPTTSKPPPPLAPRPTYQKPIVLQHLPPFKSPLPPLTTRPPDRPGKVRLPGQITPTYEAKTFTPKVAEAPAFEVHEGARPAEPPAIIKTPAEAYAAATQAAAEPKQGKMSVKALLASTSGLRDAIILREIVGPPRSLQPLDLIGSV